MKRLIIIALLVALAVPAVASARPPYWPSAAMEQAIEEHGLRFGATSYAWLPSYTRIQVDTVSCSGQGYPGPQQQVVEYGVSMYEPSYHLFDCYASLRSGHDVWLHIWTTWITGRTAYHYRVYTGF